MRDLWFQSTVLAALRRAGGGGSCYFFVCRFQRAVLVALRGTESIYRNGVY